MPGMSPRLPGTLLRATVLGLTLAPAWSAAADIDACKYFRVAELAAHTIALDAQLTVQGARRGFTMIAARDEAPPADAFMVCTVVGSWLGSVETGQLSIRVINEADGTPVAAAEVRATNRLGFEHMLRTAAERAFDRLGYSGFDQRIFESRMRRQYPSRPTYDVSKAWLTEWKPSGPLEGVWANADGAYRLAILPSPRELPGTHIAVVVEARSPLWRPGEIKIEFTSTASAAQESIAATFYMLNKQPLATSFAFTANGELEATLVTPGGRQVFRLKRAGD